MDDDLQRNITRAALRLGRAKDARPTQAHKPCWLLDCETKHGYIPLANMTFTIQLWYQYYFVKPLLNIVDAITRSDVEKEFLQQSPMFIIFHISSSSSANVCLQLCFSILSWSLL